MKLTKRKGFNFFRSYYDVYNELDDKAKVQFIDALLDRQFLGVKPTELKGMANFAYISQTNSIDSQVKGYEDKTGTSLQKELTPPTVGVNKKDLTPTLQVEVQEKEKEKEKGKEEVQGKRKSDIEERKLKFADTLEIHLDRYGKDMLNKFFHYWTEHNEDGKKLRFEYAKNQPFNTSRRLITWSNRNKESIIKSGKQPKEGE